MTAKRDLRKRVKERLDESVEYLNKSLLGEESDMLEPVLERIFKLQERY